MNDCNPQHSWAIVGVFFISWNVSIRCYILLTINSIYQKLKKKQRSGIYWHTQENRTLPVICIKKMYIRVKCASTTSIQLAFSLSRGHLRNLVSRRRMGGSVLAFFSSPELGTNFSRSDWPSVLLSRSRQYVLSVLFPLASPFELHPYWV